jgi:hydrogenase maturation protease
MNTATSTGALPLTSPVDAQPATNRFRCVAFDPRRTRSSGSPSTTRNRETHSTIIVGLGNDIAGDDAVGILAARRLHVRMRARRDICTLELPWGGLALVEALRSYARAVIIDSLRSGCHPPGTVVELGEADFAGSVRLTSFHDLNYPTALALGRSLGWRLPGEVAIFAIEGEVFDRFTTELSARVRMSLDRVVEAIATRLEARSSRDHAEVGRGIGVSHLERGDP